MLSTFWVAVLNEKNRLNYTLVYDQAKYHFYELKERQVGIEIFAANQG